MKNILILFTALILFSCDDTSVYKEIDRHFDDNRWPSNDEREFSFTITDSSNYDIVLHFTHVAGFQFDLIPIKFALKNPEGKTVTENFLLRIKDAQGADRGDCLGDYCDVEQAIFNNYPLSKGTYTVMLSNNFPRSYLPNVIAIGIEVRKSVTKI